MNDKWKYRRFLACEGAAWVEYKATVFKGEVDMHSELLQMMKFSFNFDNSIDTV
ncbi:hypothetical protein QWY16_09950 [Planococcus shenhongbingii]|uniref:hypothetical protein n=1 Tax=Planococcus shenhongbingii TaxID=3058398 RepID=UPI002630671A|nr:hypothetical protein [Planococcus sp. N016]WKA56839.1 hypothetical protein QWY16_09950 [Planococcus sp. N016]